MKDTINAISSEPTSQNSPGYYYQVYSKGCLNIESLVNQVVKNVGYYLNPSSTSLGRIDLANGNVISLDFWVSSSKEGTGTSGVALGTSEHNHGIWGNKWVISMAALTMNGERNLIQTFKFTQPMLSRYWDHATQSEVEEKHIQLVEDHLNQGVEAMISFLTHYLNRIENP